MLPVLRLIVLLAQPHPAVSVVFQNCPPGEDRTVRHLVALDLGAVTEVQASKEITQSFVTCDGDVVHLRVEDPTTAKSLARSVKLPPGTEGSRPRLIALALAELVMASWTELVSNPNPSVPAVEPAVSPESRAAALEAVRSRSETALAVLVFGNARAFPLSTGTVWGAGARMELGSARSPWRLGFDLLFERQQTTTPAGPVTANSLSGSIGEQLGARWGIISASVGLSLRIGLAQLAAPSETSPGGTYTETFAWGGPALVLSGGLITAWRVFFRIAAEVGYDIFPNAPFTISAGGTTEKVGLWGPWIGLSLAAGYFP